MKQERFATAALLLLAACGTAFAQVPQTAGDAQARDVLRKTLGQETAPQAAPAAPRVAAAPTNGVKHSRIEEMEQRYLEGKISAREFQRFLQTYRAPAAAAKPKPAPADDLHTRALEVLRSATPNAAANPQGPAIREPLPELVQEPADTNAAARATAIQDAETKLDELIRKKEARDQAATNAPATTANSVPVIEGKTKRERLDQALRLYIEGKLTDAQYKEVRAKILAEP
jgi:hypothetical protein